MPVSARILRSWHKIRVLLLCAGMTLPGCWMAAGEAFGGDHPARGEGAEFIIAFESWSNRLAPMESWRLDGLAEQLLAEPDCRLLIFAPRPDDVSARHFASSRLATVLQELDRRGVAAREVIDVPQARADPQSLTLRIVPRDYSKTPVEVAQNVMTANSLAVTVAAMPVSVQTDALPPVPLIPAESSRVAGPVPAIPLVAPAPVSSVPPEPTPPPSEEVWSANTGQTLRSVLKDWTDRAAWTLVWQSDREYPIEAAASFSGDFMKVAGQLFEGFAGAAPAPLGHFFKGNHVLLVESGEGR